MVRVFVALLLSVAVAAELSGSGGPISLAYYLPDGAEYDPSVPTPASFLGFEPGEWHLRHDQLVGYLRALSEVSDRMTLVEYGRTHEEKPLYLLKVSHPENLARLDEIRARQ